jgi:HK97 family phage portal protein
MYTDYTTSQYHLIKDLIQNNNWVAHASHIVASSVIACEPTFVLSSSNISDNVYIKKLQKVFKKPNRNETWAVIMYLLSYSLWTYGNAFLQVIRSNNGQLHSLYSIPADTIRPVPYIDTDTGELRYVYAQIVSYDSINYSVKRVFTDEEVIHIKMPNIFTQLYGASKLTPLFSNIKIDINTKTYLNNFMENSFSGGMIFELKDSSEEIVERNREELIETLSGSKNAGRNMILEGEIRLVHDGNKTKDFPLKELYQKNAEEIFACLNVPLSLAGIRSQNGTINDALIQQEEQVFYRSVVRFLQNLIYQDITLKVFGNILGYNELKIESGVNKDFTGKNAENRVMTGLKVGGTINEFRQMIGMPKASDDKIGELFVIGTNNGAIPLTDYFANIEKEGSIKDLNIKSLEQNLNNPELKTSSTSVKKTESVKQPSPSVSPKSGETEIV